MYNPRDSFVNNHVKCVEVTSACDRLDADCDKNNRHWRNFIGRSNSTAGETIIKPNEELERGFTGRRSGLLVDFPDKSRVRKDATCFSPQRYSTSSCSVSIESDSRDLLSSRSFSSSTRSCSSNDEEIITIDECDSSISSYPSLQTFFSSRSAKSFETMDDFHSVSERTLLKHGIDSKKQSSIENLVKNARQAREIAAQMNQLAETLILEQRQLDILKSKGGKDIEEAFQVPSFRKSVNVQLRIANAA